LFSDHGSGNIYDIALTRLAIALAEDLESLVSLWRT